MREWCKQIKCYVVNDDDDDDLENKQKSKNNTNKLSKIKQILPSTFYQLLVFSWDFWWVLLL